MWFLREEMFQRYVDECKENGYYCYVLDINEYLRNLKIKQLWTTIQNTY